MGVRGLTSLIETHSHKCKETMETDIYRDILFQGQKLVIDGNNLFHLLYFGSGLEQNHGGEYAAFEDLIEKFFTALRTCNITPYVVLDGGMDVTGKKFQTLSDRAEDRKKNAHRADVEGTQENVLPLLVYLVFRQTLDQLKVRKAMCYEEADQEIAALAKELRCPVLSSDSDFYIFDIQEGLLPFSHFQWRALEQKGSQSFIPCKNYRTASLCSSFGIQKELLPTFAVLAGNDYVKQMSTINWAQFYQGSEEKQRDLWGLLCWLKSFQLPGEAVEAALKLMQGLDTENRQKVRDSLETGMQEYRLRPSSLRKFLTHRTPPPFPDAAGVVPDWIQLLLVKCEMTSKILDVLRLKNRSLTFCVGSAGQPSPHVESRPLRQKMYGLLLSQHYPNLSVKVMERDKMGTNESVKPIVTATSRQLQLNSLHKAEHSLRLQVLLEALEVSKASLSGLPPLLCLPVAVTRYWWWNAVSCLDEHLLKALLLGLSFFAQEAADSPKIKDDPGPVIPESVQRFISLTQETIKAPKIQSNQSVAHSINQWQICLEDTIHLNQLLSLPLPEPQVSRLYEGALVHYLVQQMTSGKLKNFLEQNIPVVEEYKKMLTIVHSQPRKRKADPKSHDDSEEEAEDTTTMDPHLDDEVPDRVRHRAKTKRKR